MGRRMPHVPRCRGCGAVLPHYLMVCIRLRDGRKIHYCIACNEKYRSSPEGIMQ